MDKSDLSLANRYATTFVNEVFSDNIVLTLHYLKGDVPKVNGAIDWNKAREPFEVSFTLKPGETFAFQKDVLPQFSGKVGKTTNATFSYDQGFRSSGFLMGDGVCHLASFMNKAASEAGLLVVAPARHDFAQIPDIGREFGTSIFYMPGNTSGNAQQNLYITNASDSDVIFKFQVTKENIQLIIKKDSI